jgi:small subunit ribosomal protein S2
VTTERRLHALRPGRRPGPRAGSRPANARPPQYREPTQTITPAAEMPEDDDEQAEDDLTLIFGIGPARFARLREAGISTFAALAIADAEQLRDILSGVGVGNADVTTWPEQASLAAKGDWEAFEAMQEQLRAERE